MDQQVKVLATEPMNLSSILESIWWERRTDSHV